MENVSGKARRQFRVILAAGMPLLTTILGTRRISRSVAGGPEAAGGVPTEGVAKDKQAAASSDTTRYLPGLPQRREEE